MFLILRPRNDEPHDMLKNVPNCQGIRHCEACR